MASLMNGLSALGQGVSAFAGTAGLELQKSQLANQSAVLADQLATTRETGLQTSGGVIAAAAAEKAQGAAAANIATEQAGATGRTVLSGQIQSAAADKLQAFELAKARLVASLPTPEEREVRAYTGGAAPGTPEYRKGVSDLALVKLGMDPNTYSTPPADGSATTAPSGGGASGGSGDASPPAGTATGSDSAATGSPKPQSGADGGGTSGPSSSPSGPTDKPASSSATPTSLPPIIAAAVTGNSDGAPTVAPPKPGVGLAYKPIEPGLDRGAPSGGYNERALLGQPAWLVSMVHAMNEGRQEAPTPRSLGDVKSLATPEGRAGALLAVYNPNFDAGLYPARVKMRADISTGPIGDGIAAANTVIQHATEFTEAAGDLNNGRIPILNWISNNVLDATGSPRPGNLREAVGTLASEARKVYASSGGGTQSELDSWEKNFPVNGSPAQQTGAMKTLVGLLQGKLTATAGRINAGMQTNITGMDLLNPTARASFDKLVAPPQPGGPPADTWQQRRDAAMGRTSVAPPAATPPAAAIPSWAQPGDQYNAQLGLARRADGTTYGAPK
jgi:hypothetical protein